MDPQSAFADALARARQIAAKINNPAGGDIAAETAALKRPFEGSEENQPAAKKVPPPAMNDPIGAQLRAIADQQSTGMVFNRTSEAVQAAAAAARQINQKLGTMGATPQPAPAAAPVSVMPPQPPQPPMGGPPTGMGAVQTEEYKVPDKMVGLIIGKGGENISRLQAESGCKIQMAPDSGGLPERMCTLTGTVQSIETAKSHIMKIIEKGQGVPDAQAIAEGQTMIEIMVPGNKVGLVIGKGGETIKQLQERAGVKMVMIQDSNQPTHHDKPLRITGEPMRCERAKEMVMDLITEKELESLQRGGDGGPPGEMTRGGPPRPFGNEYGGGMGGGGPGGGGPGPRNSMEIRVPRQAVGVVIGKGGDMIKKIQAESGARVQFNQNDDMNGSERTCTITGPPEKMQMAASMINDLIQSTMNRERGPPGMGRGRGRGRPDDRDGRFDERRGPGGPGGPPGRGPPGPGRGFDDRFQDETTYCVPADKCGLVIGKGGETIREINRQSGAFVELQRHPSPNPAEKVFTIRGNPQQIQHAIQLISEKAGLPPGPGGGGGPGGPGGPGGQGGPPGPGGPGGFDQYGNQPNNYGQQNQQPPQPSYAPQGWGNAYQQWQGQNNPNDPNKAAADANAAAWAAYYAQFYNQGQPNQQNQQNSQPPQPPQQPQQPQPPQQQQQPQQAQPTQQQQQAQPSYQGPTVNPQTGQLDYSAAWAEYYRQQGMHFHAQAILAQAGSGQGQAPGPGQPAQ